MTDHLEMANPPKHRAKRQPTADVMRDQLALAANTIIDQRTEVEDMRHRWWGAVMDRDKTDKSTAISAFCAGGFTAMLLVWLGHFL
jgi:hypothetical protein